MNTITHWIDTPLAEALGWTLFHSLWQGAVIALLLAIGLIVARNRPSATRYRMAFSAMLSLLVACIATLAWVYGPAPGPATADKDQEVTLFFADTQEALSTGNVPVLTEAATDHPTAYLQYFEQHLPLLVTGWLLGVLLLSLRMLGEIAYIQHLKNYRWRRPEGVWLEKFNKIKEQMDIRQSVELRETYRIHSPMVVGVFKQAILLPAGLLTGLTPGQVEAVLAHELAHVRRHDYLANLLVSIAEILLFFNPMMWWISRKIRAEREHACDEIAVEMTGDTLALVRSLALMEEWRLNGLSPAMAFTGKEGSVLGRIQRLLQRDDKRKVAAKAFWSLSILCVTLSLLAFQSTTGQPVPATEPAADTEAAPEGPTEAAPIAEAEFIAPPVSPEEPSPAIEPDFPVQPQPKALSVDTIPAQAREAEREARQLEEKLRASEMELRKKEQALRRKELQLQKESQEEMQIMQKNMLELELQIRNKEHEREMLGSEFEIARNELETASLELEEQRQALELQEEELENTEGQGLQQKLKALQQGQRALLEKERALELRMFEAQKNLRQQSFEKEKAIQELRNQRFQMEQAVEMKGQEMEFKRMDLHHEMQQLEANHRMMEQEVEAKYRELEARLREMEKQEE